MIESGAEEMYQYDANLQQSIRSAKPWEKDPHYFKVHKFTLIKYELFFFFSKFSHIFYHFITGSKSFGTCSVKNGNACSKWKESGNNGFITR